MNVSQIFIENIAVGLNNVNSLERLDLNSNEYLVVGERQNMTLNTLDTEYNTIITSAGLGVNTTRRIMRETNAGLYVNNDIICKGKLIANSISLNEITLESNLTEAKLTELIKSVNNNLLFFKGYSNIENELKIDNIYTPSYLTIGGYTNTYSNAHALNIVENGNGKVNNIQFAIRTNIDNSDNEPSKLGIGCLGYSENSPANIITTKGMPLEFHISKSSSSIDNLYLNGGGIPVYSNNNFPTLAIDINGCVNINKNTSTSIIYNNKTEFPKLNVNGAAIFNDILMYDITSNSYNHLDNIYLKQRGLTLNANQIRGGDFVAEKFSFNSNVSIGKPDNKCELLVSGSETITDTLNANNLIAYNTVIDGTANFNELATFNENVIFKKQISLTSSLNVNDLFIGGYRVIASNLNIANNAINLDAASNLAIAGRLGTGILNTDSYDHQFNIIKRDVNKFEIFLQESALNSSDSCKVYMGHTPLNILNKKLDNSFVILTEKNTKWHNIYFFPGKNLSIKSNKTIPTLAIIENNRVGINTNIPDKTFDVIGDIIANDYYIRKNNISYKANILYIKDDATILNATNINLNLDLTIPYTNKKTLNVAGSINSYDGYYEGDYKLTTFKEYSNKISTTFNNIGIGISNTDNIYNVPLQIRNTNIDNNNNSIIRIFRGKRGGGINNNSLYTGIDFCDYDMPYKTQNKNNYKWFIYKYNQENSDKIGPLQIGYTNNTYNPTHSCINFYYNPTINKYHIDINNPVVNQDYNNSNAVSIKGNVEIEGNLNLKGDNCFYMINGAIVGTFSNIQVINKIYNQTNQNELTDKNDIALIGNKLILLPNKTTVIGFNDDLLSKKITNLDTDANLNSPLIIYNKYDFITGTTGNLLPVITKFYNKAYKNYISTPSPRPDNAIIELGIISSTLDNNNDKVINNVNLHVKGFENSTIFEITPNNQKPFFNCINQTDNFNQINFGNKANQCYNNFGRIITSNTCIQINDESDCLLNLINDTKPVKILLNNLNNSWELNTSNKLNIIYNNKNLFNIENNGIFNFNKVNNLINTSTININSISNKAAVELTNYYTNDDDGIFTGVSKINIPVENLQYSYNNNKFIYNIADSNLPLKDINNNLIVNYYLSNTDIQFNPTYNIGFTKILNNISLDYRNIEPLSINTNGYLKIIPKFTTADINLTASVSTFTLKDIENNIVINNSNYNVITKYLLPETTLTNELDLNNTIKSISYNVSTSNYDVVINTDLIFLNNLSYKPLISLSYPLQEYQLTNGLKLNITNIVNYNPIPNINIKNILINLSYTYKDDIIVSLPSKLNIFSSYDAPNPFFTINTIDNISDINIYYYYLNNVLNPNLINISSLTIPKQTKFIYPIELNNVFFDNLELIINKNEIFQIYDFQSTENYHNFSVDLDIILNDYKPHMVLKNHINSKTYLSHKIFSYENKYEIFLDNKKLLSLESNGDLKTDTGSLYLKDVYVSGDLYYKNGENISRILNSSNETTNNYYINKSETISLTGNNIILNPNIYNGGGISINNTGTINNSNNLFEINNNNCDNNNFISLNSVSTSAFINFHTTESLFKIGINSNSFGIWKTTSNLQQNYIDNSLNTYNNILSINNLNNSNVVNINCDIKTSNNLNINGIVVYANDNINDLNYKMRVYGNIKVDGDVITTSDKRIKSEIKTIENALDKIDKLTGITYKNNLLAANKRYSGLIAQEVNSVLPEVVYEDENGYLNIAYGNLTGLIIEAIKELRNEIKELKK